MVGWRWWWKRRRRRRRKREGVEGCGK